MPGWKHGFRVLTLLATALCGGCGSSHTNGGSGGGGGGGGQPPSPDFTLQASPSTLTLTAGGAVQNVSVSATAQNGFTGTIAVAITGLPTGVTTNPASLNLNAGAAQTVGLSAAGTATAQTVTLQFNGTSGSLSHSAQVGLTVAAATKTSSTGIDVTTWHDDVARTGLNPNETTLTPQNVNSKQFGLIRMLAADGKVDAQPLLLSGLTIGGTQHNVVYVATENDSVYAYDADSGAQLWKTSVLGTGETPSGDFGCGQITPKIGITSTPVIDRSAGANGTIYVVGMTLDSSGNYHQRLHALDVTTGAERLAALSRSRRPTQEPATAAPAEMLSSTPSSMRNARRCCCSTATSTWAGPRTAMGCPIPAG